MKELFIVQRDKNEDLYLSLQREALKTVQQFSGELWTDYNVHDPGITIMDILNYAITEFAYKLNFPIEDYLTDSNDHFNPEVFGLFLPNDIFSIPTVTQDDYRNLFLSNITELEDVWIEIERETGKYFIQFCIFEFLQNVDETEIAEKIKKLYNANRNLCESLEVVEHIQLERLNFQAEVNIVQGNYTTNVLVRIFHEISTYLLKRCSTLKTQNELYLRLLKIQGVESIHSCYLIDTKGEIVNHFDKAYSPLIPKNLYEFNRNLKVKINGVAIDINFERFINQLNILNITGKGYLKPHSDATNKIDLNFSSKYHDIYEHVEIAEDFPECYGINSKGLPSSASNTRKAQAKQLKGYLNMFDFIFEQGLKELADLRTITTLNYHNEDDILKKSYLLEMLDTLYGENSNPDYLDEYDYAADSPTTKLRRRINFLKRLPEWGLNRFKAYDFTQPLSSENTPGVKSYISALMDWQCNENIEVSKLFPNCKGNCECETMYVVEHIFFKERETFTITIVLPDRSVRFATQRFRNICRKLILSRIPAHIKVNFKWMNIENLKLFEYSQKQWREGMITKNYEQAKDAMNNIELLFKELS
ncbi:MAG: hypothetical protein LBM07_02245 [Culturomica sp.]|nr:hypothetical protein [Culturomica sp.]